MQRLREIVGKVPTGLLTIATLALILWLTLAPHPTGDLKLPLFPGADKIVHMVMFGFLTLMALLESMKHRGWNVLSLPFIGVISILAALAGTGIEFVQRAMGLGRSFEILDILADSAGALAAGGLWAMFQGLIARKDED